jgi:hypothetical protein
VTAQPGCGPLAGRRGYQYPDRADEIPPAAIRPNRVRGGAPWGEADVRIVREVAARLGRRDHLRAADVGAGAGRLLPVLADVADSITVIEPDPVRLAAARATAAGLRATAFDFEPRRAEQAGPAVQRCDLVLCSHVVQHIASGQRAVFAAALAARTAPDGLLAITFPATTARRDRYLLSELAPAGTEPAIRTSEVGRAAFDRAAAGQAGPAAVLPVWHAGRGQIENLLAGAGLTVLSRFTYRSFTFDLWPADPATAASASAAVPPAVRARAADMCVLARPSVAGPA